MGTVLSQIRQYKKETLLTPLFAALEVVMEVLLPFVTALIIDEGLQKSNFNNVLRYGVVMAALSLLFGALAGRFAARASAGLACNLRQSLYDHVQEFSFSNIDHFGTASLVTRMTTDVTNVQNAFQMILRIAVRAPLMLVCSMVMAFLINPRLSWAFVAGMVFLAAVLALIVRATLKLFDVVFAKYDDLNASVQENVSAIRVVKAYVREGYENEKFTRAADNLYRLFVKAEGLLAFNNPAMMLVIYSCILAVAWLGAQFIVGGTMTTGQLTSMLSYIMGIMMSLMMLSMIFVMITMSAASVRRIEQVLSEKPELHNPAEPVKELADGSIDFDHVSFAYRHGTGKNVLTDIDVHIRSGETWCCRRTCCSRVPFWKICAGAMKTPPVNNAKRCAAPPVRTSSSARCPTATTPSSSGAAPTCPAGRSSGCALPAPF